MSKITPSALFRIVLAILIVSPFSACHIPPPFTQKELECTNNISALLYGATVTLNKRIDTKDANDNRSNLTIDIEGFNYDTSKRKISLLFASSMPAYIFYTSGIEKASDYSSISILLKTKDTTIKNRYTMAQLKQIDPCMENLNTFLNGIVNANADSLTSASNSTLLQTFPPDTIVKDVNALYQRYGKPKDVKISGFQFEQNNGHDYIHFSVSMQLAASYQIIEVWATPDTHKVSALSF